MIDRINKPIIDNKIAENKKNKSFKGGETALLTGLRGLSNSPALGACAVDLGSMVIPRSAIEFKNRGPQAGIEALVREGMSCFIHACVGLIGYGAATLLSGNINKKAGVKAQNIFASGDTVKNMASIWNGAKGDTKQFFGDFVKNIRGLNGEAWKSVSTEAKSEIVDNLVKLSEKTAELAKKTGSEKAALSKEVKSLKSLVTSQIVKDTGAQASYKLNAVKDVSGKVINREISLTLPELVDSAVSLSSAFKTKTAEKMPEFVNSLVKNKTASTVLGLAICAALCVSVQPINKFLTKKRTGQDGFVGVEDKKADKSKGFKAMKTALGLGFPLFGMSIIGKPSELISNVQFNSKIPALNQFKLLYSMTIASRFLSARDKNELRESVIKDTLGYTNWLIFGGMVSKLTARALGGKELINNPVVADGGAKKGVGYAAKWLAKASTKSMDEVLLPQAKELLKDGKKVKFSEMYKNATPKIQSQIKKLAVSQVAGYLYSGIVLGVGIAKLNIFITKKLQEKKAANKDMANKTLDANKKSAAPVNTLYIGKLSTNNSAVFKEFN